jgi:hypothetical protein
MTDKISIDDAPLELQVAIEEFWSPDQWDNAASIAQLESGFNAFALLDTTDASHPCGAYLETRNGVRISAERSVGYYQINTCNLPPDWEWQRLYNARHNAGTAHDIWSRQGWGAWYFSAKKLGLV